MTRGWFNLPCWNGLSAAQQERLIEHGNLPLGYRAEGICPNGATVSLETQGDQAPGPRFYCIPCAIVHLGEIMSTCDDTGGESMTNIQECVANLQPDQRLFVNAPNGRDMVGGVYRDKAGKWFVYDENATVGVDNDHEAYSYIREIILQSPYVPSDERGKVEFGVVAYGGDAAASSPEVHDDVLNMAIACVAYARNRGYGTLAAAMRGAIMEDHGWTSAYWDAGCADLINYAERKGCPGDATQFERVRFES